MVHTTGFFFARPPERATYHSAGGLTSLICDGQEFPLRGEFVVSFEGGVRATLQPHDQRSPITREGNDLHWKGVATFPNSGQAQFDVGWTESDSGVTLDGAITSGGPSLPGAPAFRFPLPIESADYVIDLPRATFAGWTTRVGRYAVAVNQATRPGVLHGHDQGTRVDGSGKKLAACAHARPSAGRQV